MEEIKRNFSVPSSKQRIIPHQWFLTDKLIMRGLRCNTLDCHEVDLSTVYCRRCSRFLRGVALNTFNTASIFRHHRKNQSNFHFVEFDSLQSEPPENGEFMRLLAHAQKHRHDQIIVQCFCSSFD